MLVSPTLSGEQRRMTKEALDLAPDIGHNRALLPPQERVLSQSSIFGQNPKIWCQEFNDLEAPKLSKKQLCDRTQKSGGAS
jgi:hypothetical protein